jgi:hypothetical protein
MTEFTCYCGQRRDIDFDKFPDGWSYDEYANMVCPDCMKKVKP